MADGAPQIWDIPLTPAQRWALTQLAFHKDAPQVTDSAGGKKLRRALRAFGLMEIRDTLKAHDKISATHSANSTPALHKITAENLECVLAWSKVSRHVSLELDSGEVFDLLEQIKEHPADYQPPEGVPAFVASAESWVPPPDDPAEITCPSCGQTFAPSESENAAA